MGQSHYVAFDLGAESGRAILGTLEGDRLALETKHRFANPSGTLRGTLYWDLLAQWQEIKTGLRMAATDATGKKRTLAGIGIDTWGVDFGLLDEAGNLIGLPVHYRDKRTDGIMEKTFARVPADEIFTATGNQFMPFNTLYQLLALKQQDPAQLAMARQMLFVPDLFNYLLSGVAKIESTIASTSQMINPRTGTWAMDLLEKLSLPTNILGEIVPAGTVLGNLLPDVAAECSAEVCPVIAPACHDTASAVAAAPAQGQDWCYISSGTWSLMGVEIEKPLINDKTRKYNYTNEGGVNGTIRLLRNIMGLWLVQECRRHWVTEGYDHSYAELTQMALTSKPLEVLLDPDHTPFLTPGQMPIKIEAYCKQTRQRPPLTRGSYIRACLEGLALAYRRTLEGLEDILGRKINTIHIVGGGCQNELLNQMTANACGRTVVAGPIEATSIGNILVQAMGTGQIKSLAQGRQIVANSFPVKHYEPKDVEAWQKAYEKFRSL